MREFKCSSIRNTLIIQLNKVKWLDDLMSMTKCNTSCLSLFFRIVLTLHNRSSNNFTPSSYKKFNPLNPLFDTIKQSEMA